MWSLCTVYMCHAVPYTFVQLIQYSIKIQGKAWLLFGALVILFACLNTFYLFYRSLWEFPKRFNSSLKNRVYSFSYWLFLTRSQGGKFCSVLPRLLGAKGCPLATGMTFLWPLSLTAISDYNCSYCFLSYTPGPENIFLAKYWRGWKVWLGTLLKASLPLA